MTIQEQIQKLTEQLTALNSPYSVDSLHKAQTNIIKELPELLGKLMDATATLSMLAKPSTDPDDEYGLDYYQSYGRLTRIIEHQRAQAQECLNRLNK